AGILVIAAVHLALVVWMLKGLAAFKRSPQFTAFWQSHMGLQWMVRPLVLAMLVNVLFILGLVFVPGLWHLREMLFPGALLAFFLIAIDAVILWMDHLSELYQSQSDSSGSGLAGMFPAFTFAMLSVGFSASAAMSHHKITAGIGFVGAVILMVFALFIASAHFVVQFPRMMSDGVKPAASGTLWMAIPISTILGIAAFRLLMSAQHVWGAQVGNVLPAAVLLLFLSVQVFFYLLGRAVMNRNNGWRYLVTESPQAASFSLICPGVGLFVMGMFVVFRALMPLEVVDSVTMWLPLMLLIVLQMATFGLFIRLMRKAMPKGAHS
ncbi:MAG: TsoY family (seleno)protein, partial [Fluviibacter sp.]